MRQQLIAAVVWAISAVELPESRAQELLPSYGFSVSEYQPDFMPSVVRGQDYVEEEFTPSHIRDNAFLVEEAFNQEPGVVQHIFNQILLWDWAAGSHTRDFASSYTMEVPLGSQKHQFSFTTQLLTAFEKIDGSPPTQQGDFGDTFLNYRYQLLSDDEFLWSAPRATLILPTSDERFGFGINEVGYQFNLPVSKYGESFDFHFNSGITFAPNVSTPLANGSFSNPHDLRAYNGGASIFWKPETYLHFFLETFFLFGDEIDELGNTGNFSQVLLNPGVRYAICQFEDVEWVVGTSVPIGLTNDSPDIGAFVYMSVEHVFRRAR